MHSHITVDLEQLAELSLHFPSLWRVSTAYRRQQSVIRERKKKPPLSVTIRSTPKIEA